MISFRSCLGPEIQDFLAIREKNCSTSAYAHDRQIMEQLDRHLTKTGCSDKNLTEQPVLRWIATLSGKSSTIANKVIHPTVHSLRHTFVVMRMNQWMEEGIRLEAMMLYLRKYLGHASVNDTFYYYHQVESAFHIIREKDTVSQHVIPEVYDYEEKE